MKGEWWLYIVRCAKGAYYTGIALDVSARVARHNAGRGAKSLRALGLPVTVVYREFIGPHGTALRRERVIKKLSRPEKERLIQYGPHQRLLGAVGQSGP